MSISHVGEYAMELFSGDTIRTMRISRTGGTSIMLFNRLIPKWRLVSSTNEVEGGHSKILETRATLGLGRIHG
jgi:hypothetical protein